MRHSRHLNRVNHHRLLAALLALGLLAGACGGDEQPSAGTDLPPPAGTEPQQPTDPPPAGDGTDPEPPTTDPAPTTTTDPAPTTTTAGAPPDTDTPPPDEDTPPPDEEITGPEDGTTAPGDGGATTAQPPADEPEPETPSPAADEGIWLDGEPVWIASYDDASYAAAEDSMGDDMSEGDYEMAADDMAAAEAAPAPPPPASSEAPPPAEPGDDMSDDRAGDRAEYEMVDEAGFDEYEAESGSFQEPLTGGAIDDNERFEGYLAYRQELLSWGISIRDLDPTGRILITVTGRYGLPAAGAEVQVVGDGVEVDLRTTADGSTRFHPEAYGAGDGPFTVTAGGDSAEAERDGSVTLQTDLPAAHADDVPVDLLFLLDATGSMADEIDQLKSTIGDVAQRIGNLSAGLDLRLGMTLYRDLDDTFVTANFNFTPDVDRFTRALDVVVADGGGDYPEALDEALADALGRPTWRPAGQALQLVFLVADAPPQIGRTVVTPYPESMLDAASRGIKIFPVSSSGTDDQAEFVFRQLAQFTGARYVFLTYGAGGRATGESSSIDESDYEELSLNDLIVRLVTGEINALAGAGPDGG